MLINDSSNNKKIRLMISFFLHSKLLSMIRLMKLVIWRHFANYYLNHLQTNLAARLEIDHKIWSLIGCYKD
jgi:hypothetical protein